jgi:hypothetical protein
MWKVYTLMFIVVAIISYLWVRGIDYMKENHPDYKGDDLFGPFDENDKDNIL